MDLMLKKARTERKKKSMDFIKNILGLILLPIVAALFVVLFPFLVIIAYINYKIGEKNV